MNRRLLILLGAVGVLAAFLFFWDLPREREREEHRTQAEILLPFAVERVDTLTVARADGGFTLARSPGGWVIAKPLGETADPDAVERFLGSLTELTSVRELVADPDSQDVVSFGLPPSPRGVTLSVIESDGRRLGLEVGDLSPGQSASYVRREGTSAVELASDTAHGSAAMSYQTFRLYKMFAVEQESSIVELSVTTTDQSWSAALGDRRRWFLADGRPLKHIMVRNLLHDLIHSRVRRYERDFVDDETWSAYGLHEPVADVGLTLADGRQHRIRVGNEVDEELVFARRDEERTVLQFPNQIRDVVETPLVELIDRNPVLYNFDAMESFTLVWEDGTRLTTTRDDRDYVFDPPVTDPQLYEAMFLPARNVAFGIERVQAKAVMLVAAGNDARASLDTVPIRCIMTWPDEELEIAIGWRAGDQDHWLHVQGEQKLHQIDRDLFLRMRSLLVASGRLQL